MHEKNEPSPIHAAMNCEAVRLELIITVYMPDIIGTLVEESNTTDVY